MRIFLTGGNGLVGRNLLEHPWCKELEVLAPSRKEVDLLDYRAVHSYLAANRPDLVIHAAGTVGGIQANMREPVRFLLENLDMGRNVVWGARQAGVKRLINLGSSCMYPREAENPLREEYVLGGPLEPTNEGYALAKITVARLCEYIGREDSEYRYRTLIPCNLYGRWDKFDPTHSHLIAAVIEKVHRAMISGDETVEIWGDGTARREFMYAGDLADCIMEGARRFDELPPLMNVGPGEDHAINDYYQAVADVIGFKGRFVHDLDRPVGMKQKVVAVDRLAAWGWRPGTTLHEGIAKTYRYYLEYYDDGRRGK